MKCLNIALFVSVFGIVSVCSADTKVRFDNYHVYQLNPRTREQLEVIKKLESVVDSYTFLDGVHYLNSKINVIVAPESVRNFVKSLDEINIPYDLVDTNAQASLEDEVVAVSNTRSSNYSFDEYHQLNDTYNWMRSLPHKYSQVKVFVAGRTYEGRDILGIRISNGTGRKAIFLEGGMHAREWISPATTVYIAKQLLTSQDKDVRMITENFDFYIIPHANPDGYVYTHTTNRIWRKTRTPYGKCNGADPNRNWGFHWNEAGSSNDPCSDTYAGPSAFSEIETKTLNKYIAKHLNGEIYIYISFHSYSQLLLFPYGHTEKVPPNQKDFQLISNAAVTGIAKRYGTKYTSGNIYNTIYPASGSSIDHVFGSYNATYAFCFELRPSKTSFWYGFKLPANQIIPTGEETLDSLVDMIKEAGVVKFL